MAGKDEYEVARLYLKSSFRGQVAGTFAKPVKVSYNLHPPFVRRLGIDRKLTLGPWFRVAFHGLRAARRLRGTKFDPFARQAGRREEREILAWYRDVVQQIISELRPADHAVAVRLAELLVTAPLRGRCPRRCRGTSRRGRSGRPSSSPSGTVRGALRVFILRSAVDDRVRAEGEAASVRLLVLLSALLLTRRDVGAGEIRPVKQVRHPQCLRGGDFDRRGDQPLLVAGAHDSFGAYRRTSLGGKGSRQ